MCLVMSQENQKATPQQHWPTLAQLELRYILSALKAFRGNVSEVARVLDVDRRTLHRRFKIENIEPLAFRLAAKREEKAA
jgi:transcriptional regulator of acetoin/glycerol metabolism